MGIAKNKKLSSTELRRHAEERLRANTAELHPPRTEETLQRLVHELEVHQIELEMQNAELRQAREELELSRNKYVELYDFAPVGYFTIDAHGLIDEVNLTGASLLGIERRLLLKRSLISFIGGEADRDIFLKHLREVLKKQGNQTCEVSLNKIDGTSFFAHLQSIAKRNNEDKAACIQCNIRDITIKRAAEKDLQRSQKLFHTIARVSPVGLFLADNEGRFVYVNEYWSEITGLSPDETYGEGWAKALYSEDKERVLNKWHQAIQLDLPFESEFRFQMQSSIIKWVIGKAIAERGIHGERLGCVGTITDITERKRIEEELRKAYDGLEEKVEERTSQLLAANILLRQEIVNRKLIGDKLNESRERLRNLTSHLQQIREKERSYLSRELHDELGQVLTGIKMDIRWIERRVPEGSILIEERLRSIVKLIDSAILSVQRLSMALRPPALDDFGLDEAIELMLTNFKKRTSIACEFISTPRPVTLSREVSTEVFRIFQETLTNIARHASAKKVVITLQHTKDRFTMEIRDNGRGITKKEITDPASIGLTGMRERVYALEGTLEIKGIKGKGTTVTVSIPPPFKKNEKLSKKASPE
jgi:PAS domain S-box-containing protein